MGQKYLAVGKSLSMRLWENEQPSENIVESRREYETVGFVISGKAELHLEGQTVILHPGDSWYVQYLFVVIIILIIIIRIVPRGACHYYKILESFTAVEATHPPAEVHQRDEKNVQS